jgi:N6-L-threonylcarbamoyladenine synthase
MKILSIDTSCDETSAAVTDKNKILSNIVWSQASSHAKFGGVLPSLAKRMHEERIDWVIGKALKKAAVEIKELDAIAVTIGPGLSIALGVGVDKAKELAVEYSKPLLPVNHIEAHILSPLAVSSKGTDKIKINFPAFGMCVSGGNTIFLKILGIGNYELIAETVDDAIGEALDKGARMLGLGYPGGALLEKMAAKGVANIYSLPIPLVGQEKRLIFSYSGLKTSFYRFLESKKKDSTFSLKNEVYNLAAVFQDTAFIHIERIVTFYMTNLITAKPKYFLLGGGVAVNNELKKRLRRLGDIFGYSLHIPYAKKLYGDNAGMIGVCAYLNFKNKNLEIFKNVNNVDRNPRLSVFN